MIQLAVRSESHQLPFFAFFDIKPAEAGNDRIKYAQALFALDAMELLQTAALVCEVADLSPFALTVDDHAGGFVEWTREACVRGVR